MPELGALGLFVVAAMVLAVTPGPAVLYIVTRSISQGRAAGVVSCLGVAVGGLVHVLAAALGLSAVLAASALAFDVVKYAGAAYLVYLGVRKLTQAPAASVEDTGDRRSLSSGLSRRGRGERAESQDRPVLPRLHPAVRGPLAGRRSPSMRVAREPLHPHRLRHRHDLGPPGQRGGRLVAASSPLRDHRALRFRERVPRTRPGHRRLRVRKEIGPRTAGPQAVRTAPPSRVRSRRSR